MKKKSSFFLLKMNQLILSICCLLLFCSSDSRAQTTLLSSGFEAADPTFTYTLNTGASCLAANNNPRTGTYSGQANSASGGGQSYKATIVTSSAYTFQPCRTYTINVYAKVAKCTGALTIVKTAIPTYAEVTTPSPSDLLLNVTGAANVLTTGYVLYTATFTVPATETKYIGFYLNGGGCGGGGVASMYLDDVTLIEDASASCTAGTAAASVTTVACGGGTTSLSLTGNTGTPASIQWQSSPDNVTWSNIGAGTTNPYVATAYQTTYYRAIVSLNCLTSTSNTVTVTVTGSSTKTWVTTGTTAWGTAANWSPSGVPTSCNDVIIPSGGTQPTVNVTGNCRNLTVNSGATLTLGAVNLNIYGNLLNDGNINDGAGYTNLYGGGNTWGGTGTYVNGATQNGWICIRSGASYTVINSLQNVAYLGGINITTASTGHLYLGSYTIPVTTSLYNVFNLHYQTGMINLQGGGSIDITKSDYGTGTLWVNTTVNGFGFNLADNYYNLWFTNTGGSTSFGTGAADCFVSNDMWMKTIGAVDLTTAGVNRVEVGRHFINDATFTSATAGIVMSGSAAQNISGTSITTFANLIINNSSASGVTLQQDANVSSTLTLTAGSLSLNSRLLTITNAAATAVTRTSGYVVSETNAATNPSIFQWNMGATNGTYVIPFGVSGTYIPFTFAKTAGNSNVRFSTRATASNDNTPWSTTVSDMNSFDLGGIDGSVQSCIDRWWDITALSGSSSVTANLTFTYRGSENTTTLAPTGTFGAQHWNGTSWDAMVGSGTGVTSGTGTVAVTGANSFSPWILASASAPLPIELLHFTANLNNDQVDLSWATATETNNDYFTIERSRDGKEFQQLSIVDGAGNSTSTIYYTDVDNQPYLGTSYYRLKQTDFDGKTSYSNIVAIEYNLNGDAGISIFPNPSDEGATAYVSLHQFSGQEVMVLVKDITGRILYSKETFAGTNEELIMLDFQGKLAKGTYVVTATSADKFYNKKLIIK